MRIIGREFVGKSYEKLMTGDEAQNTYGTEATLILSPINERVSKMNQR